jgi:hypothetical protein
MGLMMNRYVFLIVLAVAMCPPDLAAAGRRGEAHVDVWLRSEAGERITPRDNSADPLHPRKTCGACHDYSVITRGYHFQAGADRTEKKSGLRELPEDLVKVYITPSAVQGKGLYDRIPREAAFHPGGGPMEPSRALQEGRESNSALTPDRHSHFRESGVLEADCLMCHLPGYSLERRNAQLQARNYRWAPTAGAGLGKVTGRILAGGGMDGTWDFARRPVVTYNWKGGLFTPEGRMDGRAIRKSVSAGSCLRCHGQAMAVQTGSLFRRDNDAHVRAGFRCIDCHGLAAGVKGGRKAHHIGRDASRGSIELTGMKNCVTCHIRGGYRAARPGMPAKAPDPRLVHEEKLPDASFHLRLLTCTACHVTDRAARGGYLYDASTGTPTWYTAERQDAARAQDDMSGPARKPWRPWLAVKTLPGNLGERYIPVSLHTSQWFGEKGPGRRLTALDLETVSQAHARAGALSTVRVRDTAGRWVQRQTAASEKDIGQMLRALHGLGKTSAVFVSDRTYELKNGRVVSSPAAPGGTLELPVYHNVAPLDGKRTWGAGGCTDCHSENSEFFTKMRIRSVGRFLKQDYPSPREPNAYPQMTDWGFEEVPSHE